MIERLLGGLLAGMSLVAPALAQDLTAEPSFGDVSLSAGFTPDPFVVSLRAGGAIDASASIHAGCPGFIADAPDFDLYYNAGSLPLIISAEADADTTLIINAPDGQWYCDDDGGPGVNPKIRFAEPQTGLYDIWVGFYGQARTYPADLKISELDR
ncbi:peptidase S1 [Maricaulis sp.]|uniref:peptidase S1 n=1 Tax=Maricaulis sp. TaxID=1486257 RepID=UPI00262193A4|nr:peptidase S1 [Maricaulis sp.]